LCERDCFLPWIFSDCVHVDGSEVSSGGSKTFFSCNRLVHYIQQQHQQLALKWAAVCFERE
jgi:hypothetical protein